MFVIDVRRVDIQVFAADGTFLFKFGGVGSNDGELTNPGGISLDPNGDILIADYGNNRIQRFGPDGTFLAAWGTFSSGTGQFDKPNDVAVDAEGRVFVADLGNTRVEVFDRSGAFLFAWSASDTGEGALDIPAGLVLRGSNVYVAEYLTGRVQKFKVTGPFPAPAAASPPARNASIDEPGPASCRSRLLLR